MILKILCTIISNQKLWVRLTFNKQKNTINIMKMFQGNTKLKICDTAELSLCALDGRKDP